MYAGYISQPSSESKIWSFSHYLLSLFINLQICTPDQYQWFQLKHPYMADSYDFVIHILCVMRKCGLFYLKVYGRWTILHNCVRTPKQLKMHGYRNWPRYGLGWSGWYCHQAQHELCRPSRGRAGRHNECCAWWQYHPRQRRPYKWSISILPRSQFYKKQGKLAFSTSCTAVRPHRRLRNDAWRRDS